MSNSLFKQLGGGIPNGDLMQQFQCFMGCMQGKNPYEEINRLLQSGRVSQQQLNQAQQMEQRLRGSFRGK